MSENDVTLSAHAITNSRKIKFTRPARQCYNAGKFHSKTKYLTIPTVAEFDFTEKTGKLNRALHSSGFAPVLYPRDFCDLDEELKSLHLHSTRTHDWALINSGQRVVDTHFVFPLMHLDASDPKNYYFDATDAAINLAQNIGMKIFYRMGTSIEHTKDVHFNTKPPADQKKYAEVMAGIVRHYTQGWANGFQWDIQYWEIWNEPDLSGGRCWEGTKEEFISLFVTILKRLKEEFPSIKIGGPALCGPNEDYIRDLLNACKSAGVAPDFVSWHYYGSDVESVVSQPGRVRALLDGMGFTDTEMSINEWHYILDWNGVHASSSPDIRRRALEGPTGHNNIDSAAFTLAVLSGFQSTPLDSAFFYGSGVDGNWGFSDSNRLFNKNFYALRMFGEIVSGYTTLVKCKSTAKTVYTLAAFSDDDSKACLLLVDYRGTEQVLDAEIKGISHMKCVSATVLDNCRDALPAAVAWKDGRLMFVKDDKRSCALLVKFERP